MTETLVLLAFLAVAAVSVWVTAKRAGKTQEELKETKKEKDDVQNENLLVSSYINMSSQQLLDRLYAKREAAKKRMCAEDRLDRHGSGFVNGQK